VKLIELFVTTRAEDVEMPSKEVLDLIHRVGTNLAKDHPEMYQTLLPSALLASGKPIFALRQFYR
jgi:hypothetical protein